MITELGTIIKWLDLRFLRRQVGVMDGDTARVFKLSNSLTQDNCQEFKYHLGLAGQSADKYLISSFLSLAGQVNTKPDRPAKDGLAAHQVCQVSAPVKHIKRFFI